ncbi:hypothetical protein LIER_23597 [Lithospermum erythrorhizon]|uniref:Uncharacterized protein n=1 Tax=Lithospermum erythrorhizon TaxID=34254 RepID=A0AAV3QY26_LITER
MDKIEVVKKGKTERLRKWPTKQAKGKGKKHVKQSKSRAKAKRGETSGAAEHVEGTADPVVGAADPVQQAPNVAASEETTDPFVERRRERVARRGRGVAAMRGGGVEVLSNDPSQVGPLRLRSSAT